MKEWNLHIWVNGWCDIIMVSVVYSGSESPCVSFEQGFFCYILALEHHPWNMALYQKLWSFFFIMLNLTVQNNNF